MNLFAKSPAPQRRFLVALSFPGMEAGLRPRGGGDAGRGSRQRAGFYDNWYKSELAQPDFDLILGDIYRNQSELVVPFFCQAYGSTRGVDWNGADAGPAFEG